MCGAPRATLAWGWKRSLLGTQFLPLERAKLCLGPDNPLRDGFLLSSIARQRLYEKSPVVRLSFFV